MVTIWRDWLADNLIASLRFNDRQKIAAKFLQQQRRVTNAQYQKITSTSRATAKRDLEELVGQGLIILIGAGRGAYYQVPKKRLINSANGSAQNESKNGS